MRKILFALLLLVLCSCVNREDYYVFSFDDYSITPGYDDVNFMEIAFDLDVPETLEGYEKLKDVNMTFFGKYFGNVDLVNPTKKQIEINDAVVSKLTIYFSQLSDYNFRINGIELLDSVKDNCDQFNGEYIERNGYACAIGQKVHGKNNVIVLYGDILAFDQEALNHLEIYVEE
ncbi:MAG: hypothetical protein J6Z03_05900 [Erysipelotrichaceae bacterium]|nr:hypothetical protein [Erysipelotrichaceae bacterium]